MTTLEVILAVIALLIPATALGMDGLNQRREYQRREAAERLELERHSNDKRLQAIERLADWARRVTKKLALADLVLSSPLGQTNQAFTQKERLELASRISSLVDEGRWLFRNHHTASFGVEKAKINHGYRDNKLDPLVKTYSILLAADGIEPSRQRKDFTWKIQQLHIPFAEQFPEENK